MRAVRSACSRNFAWNQNYEMLHYPKSDRMKRKRPEWEGKVLCICISFWFMNVLIFEWKFMYRPEILCFRFNLYSILIWECIRNVRGHKYCTRYTDSKHTRRTYIKLHALAENGSFGVYWFYFVALAFWEHEHSMEIHKHTMNNVCENENAHCFYI